LTGQVFDRLGRRAKDLAADAQADAERVRALRPRVLRRFRSILDRRITALRTRHHGDFHLGQVLWTGQDFQIFDFEGEPARSLSSRRLKRSPLCDVAGMVRSFHYAAHYGLRSLQARGGVRAEDLTRLDPWVTHWHLWVSSAFLRSYLRTAENAPFLPKGREELEALLAVYLLEKAVYELGYELDNRPEWVRLPLRGILQLLEP
jgi:maltose alpha-D-glucosyltransferase/alpha-amylase